MDDNQGRYQPPRPTPDSVEKSRERLLDEMMMDYLHNRFLGPQPNAPMNENDVMAAKRTRKTKPQKKA